MILYDLMLVDPPDRNHSLHFLVHFFGNDVDDDFYHSIEKRIIYYTRKTNTKKIKVENFNPKNKNPENLEIIFFGQFSKHRTHNIIIR